MHSRIHRYPKRGLIFARQGEGQPQSRACPEEPTGRIGFPEVRSCSTNRAILILHHPEYRQRYAANLRRELPRIPFVGTGAEARLESAPNAGLKPCSSTAPSTGTAAESAINAEKSIHIASATTARSAVEERPFEGRVEKRKKDSNTALPKAVAGERSSQATGSDSERRFEKLSDTEINEVLSEIKRMQDAGLVPALLREKINARV